MPAPPPLNLRAHVSAAPLKLVNGREWGDGEANLRAHVAIEMDGSLWAWGDNEHGQSGSTSLKSQLSPVCVGYGYMDAACGWNHSVGLKNNGTVYTWGANDHGQLGCAIGADRSSPVVVSGLSGVQFVAAGFNHTLVVKSDGTVWAFGQNNRGQLGNGTTTDSGTPTQVSGLYNMIAVAAGEAHSIAVKNDGTVWAWGDDTFYQLGTPLNAGYSATPVQVQGIIGITSVAANANYSVAIKGISSSVPISWGSASAPSTTILKNGGVWIIGNQKLPYQDSAYGNDVVAIAVGNGHEIAVKLDGTAVARGYNEFGQLGNGANVDSGFLVNVQSAFKPKVGIPKTLPLGGVYPSERNVMIKCRTLNATLHYTLNGNDPTESDPTVAVGGSILIDDVTNLKIRAFAPGMEPSDVKSAYFMIDYASQVATPNFSLPAGSYSGSQRVSVSCATSGATIHYTLNGAEPSKTDPIVANGGSVAVNQSDVILKAKAFMSGMKASATQTAAYTLILPQLPAIIFTTVIPTISPRNFQKLWTVAVANKAS